MENIVAVIYEGSAEKVIINKLLDADKLKFTRDDLLDNELIGIRNAKKFENRYLNKAFNKKIEIYRILDSRTERFKLDKQYLNKILKIENVITAPEIEILVIINERKYDDYMKKKKSYSKPSLYCKEVLGLSKIKEESFIDNYFSNINDLIEAMKEYKRVTKIEDGEMCLYDLLK